LLESLWAKILTGSLVSNPYGTTQYVQEKTWGAIVQEFPQPAKYGNWSRTIISALLPNAVPRYELWVKTSSVGNEYSRADVTRVARAPVDP
jgi:hypothetical protein